MLATERAYTDLMRELWGSPLLWNEKRTYVEIARKLGIDEETVRNRIKSMKESGFLLGWRTVPNPSLLDRISSFVYLETKDQDSKDELISEAAKMDGVIVIANIYGDSLLISLIDDKEKSSERRLMDLGIRSQAFATPGMNLPRLMPFRMTATDWQILLSMLKNGEKKANEIASEVKVSAKTVNRRLDEMMSARAIFNMPLVNLRKASGISFQMIIRCSDSKRLEIGGLVSSKIPNLIFRASAAKNDLIFGFNGANVSEGNEILRWAKKLPGVESAKMNIVENVVHVFDWLEKQVEVRAAS